MSGRGAGGGDDGPDRPGEQPVGRGEDPVDVEAVWAEIVARWEEPSGSRPAREGGPEAGDAGRPPQEQDADGAVADGPRDGEQSSEGRPPVPGAPAGDGPAPGAPARPGPAPRGWSDDDVAGGAGSQRSSEPPAEVGRAVDDTDDHYVPPPPSPSPPVGGLVRAAWVGALGGPALLLVCALVWRGAPAVVVVVAVVAFVAGFGVLVSRLPRSRDDGDDDGAVV